MDMSQDIHTQCDAGYEPVLVQDRKEIEKSRFSVKDKRAKRSRIRVRSRAILHVKVGCCPDTPSPLKL